MLNVSAISIEAILERSLRQIYQHMINASRWSDNIFASIIFINTNYLGIQKRNAFFFIKTLSSSVNSETRYSQSLRHAKTLLKITNIVKFPTISREFLFILSHSREVKNISSEVLKIFLVLGWKSLRREWIDIAMKVKLKMIITLHITSKWFIVDFMIFTMYW